LDFVREAEDSVDGLVETDFEMDLVDDNHHMKGSGVFEVENQNYHVVDLFRDHGEAGKSSENGIVDGEEEIET
jgi:hypothetical protein